MSHTLPQSRLAVLLFTDIVGSTELKSKLGTLAYTRLLSVHNRLFEDRCARFDNADILKHTGDGYFAAFRTASDAVKFALLFQRAMREQAWGATALTTRVGIHIGEVAVVSMAGKPDVVGLAADLAARLMSLAAGGQILVTRAAFDDARQFVDAHPACPDTSGARLSDAPSGPVLRWLAHGRYRFKGASEALEVFEVGAEGGAPLSAPANQEKAVRVFTQNELSVLGWRPALGQSLPNRRGWRLERKLGDASFGEVWLGRQEQSGEKRVFKFCFDPKRLDSFVDVATLVRVRAKHKDQSAAPAPDQSPVFTESNYRNDAQALDLSESVLKRISEIKPDLDSERPMGATLANVASLGADKPAIDVGTAKIAEVWDDLSKGQPEHIGPYRILELLGAGGFGEVYKAERRRPMQQTVAVKVIKLGYDTKEIIARFESERQALARMDHPTVAKVLDAGATESGRPYFVMEYVPGEPITVLADAKRLSIKDRLELFIQVCEAINHAHTKALLHRDIKSGNVLAYVSDGKPTVKVIDFGIAKALTGDRLTENTFNTERGQVMGTYETMSPEQADGSPDIDTRTDVYSLGVLLYELLSGVKPFEHATLVKAGDQEIRRIIREVEPPRPSTRLTTLGDAAEKIAGARRAKLDSLTSELKGELEWIPLKAMRKERDRRYASPLQLAEDIRNYLERRPLIAGPESRSYRLKKFLRRNRGPVSAVAAVMLVIIAGTVISTSLAIKLKVALAEAQKANETSEDAIKLFTEDVIGSSNPNATLLQSLENTAAAGNFGDSPRVEVAVRNTLALIYFRLGRSDAAFPYAEVAADLGRRKLGPDHPATIRSTSNLAMLLRFSGRTADAEPLFRDALNRARRVLGNDHPDTLVFMSNLAGVLQEQRRLEAAEPLFRESLEGKRRALGEFHPETLNSMSLLAVLLKDMGRYGEAERIAQDALQKAQTSLGPDHSKTLQALRICGEILLAQDRFAEAEPLSRDSLARRRKVFGPKHLSTLMEIDNLGWCLQAQGKYEEAQPLFEELYQKAPTIGGDPRQAAKFMSRYGLLLAEQERFKEADKPLREAYQRLIDSGLKDDARTRDVITALAATSSALGKVEDAARWSALLAPSAKQNR